MYNRNGGRRRTYGWVIAGSAAAGVLVAGYCFASPRPAHLASAAQSQAAQSQAAQTQGWLPWTPAASPWDGAGSSAGGWGRGGYPMMGGPGGAVNAPAGSAAAEMASQNWAGYAVTGQAGEFTSVSASWAQPAVSCGAASAFSAFWAGLDGDGTQTVEQTGTEADCSGGASTYQGWYEVFPNAPVFYASPVQPGDAMSASVTSDGNGVFTLTLSDTTQGWTQTTQQSAAGAQLGSAEVIAEAPSDGTVLPLADFGTVNFANATVDNAPIGAGPAGTAQNQTTLNELVMQSAAGTDLATPSALTGGNAFSVTWDGAGSSGATAGPTPVPGRHHHHRGAGL